MFYDAPMASPPKNDAWTPYRPDEQRIVFIRRAGALKPYLGYIVQWPVSGMGNRFQVAYMDEGVTRAFRIEWLDRRQLVPIVIDPNWLKLGSPR
jgi:hypothetical protein